MDTGHAWRDSSPEAPHPPGRIWQRFAWMAIALATGCPIPPVVPECAAASSGASLPSAPPATRPAAAADFVARSDLWSVHLSPDGESLAYLTKTRNLDTIGIVSLKEAKLKHYTIGTMRREYLAHTERVPIGYTTEMPRIAPIGGSVSQVQPSAYALRPVYASVSIEQNAHGLRWRGANRLLIPLNTGLQFFDLEAAAMRPVFDSGIPTGPNGSRYRRLSPVHGFPVEDGTLYFAGTYEGDDEPTLWRYDTANKRFGEVFRNPGAVGHWYLGRDEGSVIGVGDVDGLKQVFLRSSAPEGWAPAVALGSADGSRVIGYDAEARLLHVLRYDGDRSVVSSMDLDSRSWADGPIGFSMFDALPWQGNPRLAGADLCGPVFAGDSGRLLGLRVLNPKPSTVWMDGTLAGHQATIDRALPNLVNLVLETDDAVRRLLLLSFSGSIPGFFSVFEMETGEVRRLMPVRTEAPGLPHASVFPVRFTATDGTALFGWVTRPTAPASTNKPALFPLIVLLHPTPGEPWCGTYNDLAQFLASRGYVVLQLNHRGTQGRGRSFFELGRAGLGAVVPDDLSAGVAELVATGRVDGSRVAVIGSGYGGHLALRALSTGRFTSGVAISPVVDWGAIARSGDAAMRRRWMKETHVFDDQDDAGLLTAQSAVTFAKDLKQPCLFILGASQAAAPLTPVKGFVKRLESAGGQAESLVIKNATDDIPEEKHRAEMFERIEAFLARTLGGRAGNLSPPASRKGS